MQKLISSVVFIVIVAIVSIFFLAKNYSNQFVEETESLIKAKFSTSAFEFKDSYFTNTGYKKGHGIVCGKVKRKLYDDDKNERYDNYYALILTSGDNVLLLKDVKFDVGPTMIKSLCER
ncbi:hypothetical protein MXZ96_06490 [Providencia stuartii]|uniref:hypothetical protein n=1 Tax=Providencia TaxID=586 RepID=UPI001FF4A53D|nr:MULTISPECIES: hypothetical protein [Providencia]MCK1142995.1 hypothetical protein [Providencia stuartii]